MLGGALAFGLPPAPAFAEDGWTTHFFGRVQYDYAQAEGDRSDYDLDRGELRTGRVGLSVGKPGTEWRAELAANNDGDLILTDVYLKLALGQSGWKVRAGNFKTPNSLSEQTSGRYTATFERAAFTDAFEFDRRAGVQLERKGARHSVYAGLFAADLNDTPFSEGHAAAARYVFTPAMPDGQLLHLGVSLRWREAGNLPDMRYRQKAFAHTSDAIVATPRFAREDVFVGAEAAWMKGPVWIAAEYGVLAADGGPAGDATFTGSYLETGYFLGGRRTHRDGRWNTPEVDRPVTEGGRGALMLAAHYDRLDLSDGAVDGGELGTLVLAADWYLTAKAHAGINFYMSEAELGATSASLSPAIAAYRALGGSDETVRGVNMRLQFDF